MMSAPRPMRRLNSLFTNTIGFKYDCPLPPFIVSMILEWRNSEEEPYFVLFRANRGTFYRMAKLESMLSFRLAHPLRTVHQQGVTISEYTLFFKTHDPMMADLENVALWCVRYIVIERTVYKRVVRKQFIFVKTNFRKTSRSGNAKPLNSESSYHVYHMGKLNYSVGCNTYEKKYVFGKSFQKQMDVFYLNDDEIVSLYEAMMEVKKIQYATCTCNAVICFHV